MAEDKTPDIVDQATPEVDKETGIAHGTRSTAVDDVDTEARAKAASLDNLSAPKADVDEATPAKLRDHYRTEIKAGRVAPSRTGLETRLRRDLGDGHSEAKITSLAKEILGQ